MSTAHIKHAHKTATDGWSAKLGHHERAHARRLEAHAALPPPDTSEHEARVAAAQAAIDAHTEEAKLAARTLELSARTAFIRAHRAKREGLEGELLAAQQALHEASRVPEPPRRHREHEHVADCCAAALEHHDAADKALAAGDRAAARHHLCQAAALAGVHGVDASDTAAAIAALDAL